MLPHRLSCKPHRLTALQVVARLVHTAAVLAGCLSAASSAVAAADAPLPAQVVQRTSARPPNIIFILADDMGYGDLSCYGQRLMRTPAIDQLAAEGIRFTQFYSASTVCAPSRASILTGRHQGHAVIRDNREMEPSGQFPLPAGTDTLPRRLQQAGYATGAFGKWGLGPVGSSGDPLRQGFDRFFGYNCQREAHDYYPDRLWDNAQELVLGGDVYAPDLIHEQSLEFIRHHRDQPFFIYYATPIPHAALQAPPGVDTTAAPWTPFAGEETRYSGGTVHACDPIASFAAMVGRLDQQVASLRAVVEELGLTDNTVLVFSSDNGPSPEGGHRPDFWRSSGPFRGVKRMLTEGALRVPFIVSWPGHIEPAVNEDLVAAQWDLAATFAQLAGIEPPADGDGVSLLPALLGNVSFSPTREYLYWEFRGRRGQQAVRMGPWKGLREGLRDAPAPSAGAPVLGNLNPSESGLQLYYLPLDPGEQANVAALHPDIVARILAIMEDARTESVQFPLFEEELPPLK